MLSTCHLPSHATWVGWKPQPALGLGFPCEEGLTCTLGISKPGKSGLVASQGCRVFSLIPGFHLLDARNVSRFACPSFSFTQHRARALYLNIYIHAWKQSPELGWTLLFILFFRTIYQDYIYIIYMISYSICIV